MAGRCGVSPAIGPAAAGLTPRTADRLGDREPKPDRLARGLHGHSPLVRERFDEKQPAPGPDAAGRPDLHEGVPVVRVGVFTQVPAEQLINVREQVGPLGSAHRGPRIVVLDLDQQPAVVQRRGDRHVGSSV